LLYSFVCEQCDKEFSLDLPVRKRNDKRICPNCKSSSIHRLFCSSVHYKGRGWATTESRLDKEDQKIEEILEEPIDPKEVEMGKEIIKERQKVKLEQRRTYGKDKLGAKNE